MAVTAQERKLLIGGEWVDTGDWIDVASPYSGERVGRVAKAGAEETRRAIDAAENAMAEPLPAHRRAEILVRVAGFLGRRHDEVAKNISDEAGKPMKAARVEARRAMSTYTFAAVEARKLAGEMVPMDASQAGEGKLAFTLRRPIGVVGAISPFNFPLNLVAHKLAPALAAGCAVVLKPASQTPLSALLLAELETEAGLPPGCFLHRGAGIPACPKTVEQQIPRFFCARDGAAADRRGRKVQEFKGQSAQRGRQIGRGRKDRCDGNGSRILEEAPRNGQRRRLDEIAAQSGARQSQVITGVVGYQRTSLTGVSQLATSSPGRPAAR